MNSFWKTLKSKKVVVFGTGKGGMLVTEHLPTEIAYYVDNGQGKWGDLFLGKPICNPTVLGSEPRERIAIVVASQFYNEICAQLTTMGFEENEHFIDGLINLNEQKVQVDRFSMDSTLSRIRDKQTGIETVIDIGASDGQWSKLAMKYFKDCSYFCIEANPLHESSLEQMKSQSINMDYSISAAGDQDGEICFRFTEGNLYSGAATYGEDGVRVPMTSVDYCVSNKKLKPPFLLKLDTHGFEIPIFEGAKKTWNDIEVIVVETYNFIVNEGVRFPQLCHYLEERGFRCVDIATPLHRPRDQSLWQMDMIFFKATHPVFQSNSYA